MPAADVPELKQVVADARQDGADLKIVVIGKNPPVDAHCATSRPRSVTPTGGRRCWC